jgi:flagellar biosynthesis GTPase FlhF
MQVKRFFAADMRQAMKLVRDELGADAAIIGNRRIAGGVELTAALDYKLSALAPRVPNMELEDELRKTQSRIVTAQAELSLRGEAEAAMPIRQLFAGLPLTAAEPLIEPTAARRVLRRRCTSRRCRPACVDSMRFELNGLRELLEVQLGSLAWNQLQGSRPEQANLWRRLQRIGLSGPLSRDLLALITDIEEPRQAWRMLLAHLARMIDAGNRAAGRGRGDCHGRPGRHGQDHHPGQAGRPLRAQVRRAEHRAGEHGQLPHRCPGAAQDPGAHSQCAGDPRRPGQSLGRRWIRCCASAWC